MDKTGFTAYMRQASDKRGSYNSLKSSSKSFMDHFYDKHTLLCECLELSMKAHLLRRGYTKEQLKSEFGHNIEKLAQELNKFEGVPSFTNYELTVIATEGNHYKSKSLIYPQRGSKEFPREEEVIKICDRLLWF